MSQRRRFARRRVALAAFAALAAAPAVAHADSLAFLKADGNIWLAGPDGTQQHQVTTDGTPDQPYRSPSQADDGTIAAARYDEILFFRQNGELIRAIDPPALGSTVGSDFDGVANEVALSPDGQHVAWSYIRYSCPIGVSCGARAVVGVMRADGTGGVVTQSVNGTRNPSWVGNSRVMVFGGYLAQVNLLDVAPGATEAHWFDDSELPNTENTDISDGGLSRDGTRLAVIHGYGSDAKVRYYAVSGNALTGPPPGLPTGACQSSRVEGTDSPTWSPDGTGLAWADPTGITVLRGINAVTEAECPTLNEQLTIPGASEPDWGPANVNPQPRTPPPPPPPPPGPNPPPPPPPGPNSSPPPPPDTRTPAVVLKFTVKADIRLARVLTGVPVQVTAPKAGRLVVTVRAAGNRGPVLATGAATATKKGVVTVTVRFTRTARQRLVRLSRTTLAVTATLRPKAGGAAIVRRGSITLKAR